MLMTTCPDGHILPHPKLWVCLISRVDARIKSWRGLLADQPPRVTFTLFRNPDAGEQGER